MGWKDKERKKLEGKRFLVIGAGGIGCELLKNIALTGFTDIHVIDMDTIDVSNLNRQFLFRREHVGKSKAEVATQAIKRMCPDIKISFDLDNIFSTKFNIPFFQKFFLVMNALDNRAARNHVNRMCLAAKVPLIESGSSGYLGQVRSIIRDRTECYECVPKPAQEKTFPGCTIRNTPSEHIHCTVWSKHAFNQLFGELDIDDDISPDLTDTGERTDASETQMDTSHSEALDAQLDGDADGAANPGAEKQENSAEKQEILANGTAHSESKNGDSKESGEESKEPKPLSTRLWAENVKYDPEKIFDKLFNDDIVYLLRMEHLWRERRAPVPIKKADAVSESVSSSSNSATSTNDVNKVWSMAECAEVFCESVAALSKCKSELTGNSILHWDKDDDDAMRFVASCANIRATIFGIPRKSLFEIKSMAGNIIPAIATTNAVVAGMVVVEALKILSGELDKLRTVFIKRAPNPRGKILVDQVPFEPNPNCFVCSAKRECHIKMNPEQMTVLKGALNMAAPDVMEATTSRIIISSEEGETADLEDKTLSELSIANGAMLMCDDFQQKLELKVILHESKSMKADEFEIFQDSGEVKENDEESRKRKSMASPEVNEEEVPAKRVKL